RCPRRLSYERGGPRNGPPHPPTLVASRGTRDAPRHPPTLVASRGTRDAPRHPPTLVASRGTCDATRFRSDVRHRAQHTRLATRRASSREAGGGVLTDRGSR